ncbi:hypothetical protein BX600DRAFT_460305 [Xylariales sp. PMI_506]|nr:hypothetical protein BX600DRAFT_460305 [Xylariales sp. PMI_506]
MNAARSIQAKLKRLGLCKTPEAPTAQEWHIPSTQWWQEIEQQAPDLMALARSMDTVPSVRDEPVHVLVTRHPTRLETLPQEILLKIMQNLDHYSLYRLTQAYDIFYKLSFDNVFEKDAQWRTLRHTADCLGDGPSRRVLPFSNATIASSDACSSGTAAQREKITEEEASEAIKP